jgi:hypothetical protein
MIPFLWEELVGLSPPFFVLFGHISFELQTGQPCSLGAQRFLEELHSIGRRIGCDEELLSGLVKPRRATFLTSCSGGVVTVDV